MPADLTVAPDPAQQFTSLFENLGTLLGEAGLIYADITEMLSFHVDMSKHMEAFTAAKDRFIKEPYPAWTAVGRTDLFQGAGT